MQELLKKIKDTKRRAESETRNLKSDIKDNALKLQRAKKKKDKLSLDNKKLAAANNRLKKSAQNRNGTIKIMLDEKEELSFELQLLCTEIEHDAFSIGTERDHKNRKVWPKAIVKIMIEMLDNGTPPSGIASNLESACRFICPNVKF